MRPLRRSRFNELFQFLVGINLDSCLAVRSGHFFGPALAGLGSLSFFLSGWFFFFKVLLFRNLRTLIFRLFRESGVEL